MDNGDIDTICLVLHLGFVGSNEGAENTHLIDRAITSGDTVLET